MRHGYHEERSCGSLFDDYNVPVMCYFDGVICSARTLGDASRLGMGQEGRNVVADKLSIGFFEDIDPKLRVEVRVDSLRWILLDNVIKWAPEPYR